MRPGRRDERFDVGYPCPKCGAMLDGLLRWLTRPFMLLMLPPRFLCSKCKTTWELGHDLKVDGVHELPNGAALAPVETGEQN